MLKKALRFGLCGIVLSSKAHTNEIGILAKRLDKIIKEEKIVTLKFGQNDNLINNIQKHPEVKTITKEIFKNIQTKYVLEQTSDSITLRIHDEEQEIDFSFINERIIVVDLLSRGGTQPGNVDK